MENYPYLLNWNNQNSYRVFQFRSEIVDFVLDELPKLDAVNSHENGSGQRKSANEIAQMVRDEETQRTCATEFTATTVKDLTPISTKDAHQLVKMIFQEANAGNMNLAGLRRCVEVFANNYI